MDDDRRTMPHAPEPRPGPPPDVAALGPDAEDEESLDAAADEKARHWIAAAAAPTPSVNAPLGR